MMKHILFFEVFQEERHALERFIDGKFCFRMFQETIQESGPQDFRNSLISIRTQSVLPDADVSNMIGILTRSTGFDHVSRYIQKGVPCGYLPSYCSDAVAEQAIIMMLSLLRKMPIQQRQLYCFQRDGITGTECFNKKVLVVGVGKIGRKCAALAKALGMNVKGADIDPREKDVDYVALEEGLAWADAVISAVSLTEKTVDMFSLNTFKQMKNSAVFVNISRGEVSPLKEIEQALKQGVISGAGLDVYDNEAALAIELRKNIQSNHREQLKHLNEQYNVIFTPHNAFNTIESVERKAQQSIESIEYFLNHGKFINEVCC